MTPRVLEFHDILRAESHLVACATTTPVLHSRELDALSGCELYFKCEHLQRSGSFKFRGACNALKSLPRDALRMGVVTYSSGNFGAALALAAKLQAVSSYVIAPNRIAAVKLSNVERYGGAVWLCPPGDANKKATCEEVLEDSGAHWVDPGSREVIAGQGTAVKELIAQTEALDALVVPVGSGTLLAGSAVVTAEMLSDCELYAVESAGIATVARQRHVVFRSRALCTRYDELQETLGGTARSVLKSHIVQTLKVDNRMVTNAMQWVWKILKQVVEPSAAIALAAVLMHPERFSGKRVGLVLTGGNIDLSRLPWKR